MAFPAAVGVCEDDLRLDLTFLKAFAGPHVDLRMNPMHGTTLDAKAARIVRRQVLAMRESGMPVGAVVAHHDVDRGGHEQQVHEIERWFSQHGLHKLDLELVACAPDPCLESWLCIIEGSDREVRRARPSAGCEPWKKAWSKGRGIPLDRVRVAAGNARARLSGRPDFDRFFRDWRRAGLEI